LILETGGATAAPQPAAPAPTPQPAPGAAAAAKAPPPAPQPARIMGGGLEVYPPVADVRVLATPGTRRLAREMNIDINQVKGTGLAGRVTREDVLKAKGHGLGATAAGQPSFQLPSVPRPAYHGPAGAAE